MHSILIFGGLYPSCLLIIIILIATIVFITPDLRINTPTPNMFVLLRPKKKNTKCAQNSKNAVLGSLRKFQTAVPAVPTKVLGIRALKPYDGWWGTYVLKALSCTDLDPDQDKQRQETRQARRKTQISKCTLPVDKSVVTRHCTFWSRIAGEAYSPAKVYYLP